jgi:hypothetical protein
VNRNIFLSVEIGNGFLAQVQNTGGISVQLFAVRRKRNMFGRPDKQISSQFRFKFLDMRTDGRLR